MVEATVSVSESDNSDELRRILEDLARVEVLVGVPEDKTSRNEGKINNAQLVYVHTHGSPLKGIPARPIIEPAIELPDNKEAITKELSEAASARFDELNGTSAASAKSKMLRHLKRAGMEAQNRVRAWWDNPANGWPPDAAETVRRKGSDKVLVDKNEMRRAITYVVKED